MKCPSRLITTSLALLLAAAALTAGCGMSEEEARQKLADLNVEYSQESFAKHASNGDQAVVDLFLKAGMDPDAEAEAELSVASLLGSWEGFERVQNEIIEKAGETFGWNASTPLTMAAMQGQEEVVRRLLKAGADPNGQASLRLPSNIFDVEDLSPLHWSALNGHAEVADLLLEAGADPSVPLQLSYFQYYDEWDGTPLMLAASGANPAVVKSLLEAGADLHAVNERDEYTALMCAAANIFAIGDGYSEDRIETIHALLEAGADPEKEDRWGNSPQAALRRYDKKRPGTPGVAEVVRLMREASTRR